MRWAIAAVLLSAAAAKAEDARPLWKWEPPRAWEAVPLVAASGLIWVDVLQSIDARRQGRLEGNPFLGTHPSSTKLVLVGGVLPTILLAVVWYALPYGWRTLPPVMVASGEALTVWDNARQGFAVIRF